MKIKKAIWRSTQSFSLVLVLVSGTSIYTMFDLIFLNWFFSKSYDVFSSKEYIKTFKQTIKCLTEGKSWVESRIIRFKSNEANLAFVWLMGDLADECTNSLWFMSGKKFLVIRLVQSDSLNLHLPRIFL